MGYSGLVALLGCLNVHSLLGRSKNKSNREK